MSRADILGRIAQALGPDGRTLRRTAATDRLIERPRQMAPKLDLTTPTSRINRFAAEASQHLSTVIIVSQPSEIPAALRAYIDANGGDRSIAFGSDAALAKICGWDIAGFTVAGPDTARDAPVGLSKAAAGIAETGCVVLASGNANPTPLAFLCETHVTVLNEKDLAATPEDAFDAIRQQSGGPLPRSINVIAGPSRTADIGGNIVIGAHGPRRTVFVVISGDARASDAQAPRSAPQAP